tara:strand:+ start:268 stop:558 length:291 start_codon:yes stop_codon:yes gene_type:complete
MSNIPLARQILQSATTMGDIRDMRVAIEKALKHMTREAYTRKARPVSRFVTDQVKTTIRNWALENPDTPMQDIAVMFGVNIGRVSEILAGKYDDKF